MRGVLHNMILTKLKVASVSALAVAMVGVAAIGFAYPRVGEKQSAERATSPKVGVPLTNSQILVEESKKLQGTWDFASLEMGGQEIPEATLKTSSITIKGDKFTTVTGGTTYKGTYSLDITKNPRTIDLIFTDGPEKGNTSLGIYELRGDRWKLCLDVSSKSRPREFVSKVGGGYALETLQRRSAEAVPGDDKAKDTKKAQAQLEGHWSMVSGEINGQAMPSQMTANAKRVAKDGETSVTINGQLFMKAKYTVDPSKKPKTIDYTMTGGPSKGKTQLGIYESEGDTVKFCFASPGQDRPTDFKSPAGSNWTLSVWKREKR